MKLKLELQVGGARHQGIQTTFNRGRNELQLQVTFLVASETMQVLGYSKFRRLYEACLGGNGTDLHKSLTCRNTTDSELLKAYNVYLLVCPYKKMSIFFANKIIKSLAAEATTLHVTDFGILYGFQWPVLIHLLSERVGGPPKLRITRIELPQPGFRPYERVNETKVRLLKYREHFGIPFEYHAIAEQKWETIKIEVLNTKRCEGEILDVSCLFRFGRLLDESVVGDSDSSPRDMVLCLIKRMKPNVFVHEVTNGSYSPFFVTRSKEVFCSFSLGQDLLLIMEWYQLCELPGPNDAATLASRVVFDAFTEVRVAEDADFKCSARFVHAVPSFIITLDRQEPGFEALAIGISLFEFTELKGAENYDEALVYAATCHSNDVDIIFIQLHDSQCKDVVIRRSFCAETLLMIVLVLVGVIGAGTFHTKFVKEPAASYPTEPNTWAGLYNGRKTEHALAASVSLFAYVTSIDLDEHQDVIKGFFPRASGIWISSFFSRWSLFVNDTGTASFTTGSHATCGLALVFDPRGSYLQVPLHSAAIYTHSSISGNTSIWHLGRAIIEDLRLFIIEDNEVRTEGYCHVPGDTSIWHLGRARTGVG